MEDLNLPIAVRRIRRSSVAIKVESSITAPFVDAKTPHKRKRAVRFSDPGPHVSSSGLTPMVRRTSIATPKPRRSSTPLKSSGHGVTTPSSSTSHHAANAPASSLHQTAEGRVERRNRRSGLRDMLNKLEQENRRKEKSAKVEIAGLRAQVKARDREIYQLQNATVVIDTQRIWDLEQQIYDLRAELARRARNNVSDSCAYSWKTATADPFVDDFLDMTADEENFGSTTMKQLQAGTPERAITSFRSSFPTPPASSPIIPATPCMRIPSPSPMFHTGVQADLPDPEKEELEEELASMHQEVSKLTATLEKYTAIGARLNGLLRSASMGSADRAASPIEAIECRVQFLLESISDRSAALDDLTSAINELGFPGADASEMISSLTSGFRAARLELEYLTPGEIPLPLTSHGAEVLDLLLTRLRILAKKSREDDDAIDEYHALEQTLRKQLDSRVTIIEGLKAEMSKAQKLMDDKNDKIRDLEIGTDRLKGAVDGYIRDMSELEKLVERMERESRSSNEVHLAEQRSKDEQLAAKDVSIADLEGKIAEAVIQTAELLNEMSDQEDKQKNQMALLHQQHGLALALRDARVMELRGEVGRVNESLRVAHETVRELRLENNGLKLRMDDERTNAKAAMDSVKEELQRVLQMSQDFLSSPKAITPESGSEKSGKRCREASLESSPSGSCAVVRAVGYLAGDLSHGTRKKLRRRYDSGLGMLNEDEVDI